MAWWSDDGHCAGWLCEALFGIAGKSLAKLWVGMTTTLLLGIVPLLGGVHQEPSPCNSSHWWTPAMPSKLYKSRVFDEAFAFLVLFLALQRHRSEIEAAVSLGRQAR
uniref:Uncharacterized protein n=1 Tax=Oryza punctata TaxID=4537 RepID=A0A0E0L3N1_ORYPU